MNNWELASILIDAKKSVDSIYFIEQNLSKISNIEVRDNVKKLKDNFYIKCCVVLDEKIDRKVKRQICATDKIIERVYYERNKNSAHKDSNYIRKECSTLTELVYELKEAICHIRKYCADILPNVLTIDFVPHDKTLFRLMYGITKDKEGEIEKDKYPFTNHSPNIESNSNDVIVKTIFHDIDDIKDIANKKSEYAVLMKNGINLFEGVQERQDGCIKINVLYGENMWCRVDEKKILMYNELRSNGIINEFDIPNEKAIIDPIIRNRFDIILDKYK